MKKLIIFSIVSVAIGFGYYNFTQRQEAILSDQKAAIEQNEKNLQDNFKEIDQAFKDGKITPEEAQERTVQELEKFNKKNEELYKQTNKKLDVLNLFN